MRQALKPGNLGRLAGKHLLQCHAAGALEAAHLAPLAAQHHSLAHLQASHRNVAVKSAFFGSSVRLGLDEI